MNTLPGWRQSTVTPVSPVDPGHPCSSTAGASRSTVWSRSCYGPACLAAGSPAPRPRAGRHRSDVQPVDAALDRGPAPHLLQGWWDAPIFWPTGGAFAFSEPQPLTGAAFALLRPVAGDVGAYSLLLIGAVALNGLAAAALARRLGATGGGRAPWWRARQATPFVFDQLGVLQLTMIWPLFAASVPLLAWVGASGSTCSA